MESRSIQELCCLTQAALFHLCLSDDDLRELGSWPELENGTSLSRPLFARVSLHKRCRADAVAARRVADRLDLAYVDTVILVRHMTPSELERTVGLWLGFPSGAALPGLAWALCTDAREAVHALGARLCHEAALVASRRFVEGTSRARTHDANC
jgi:hypothetical protein